MDKNILCDFCDALINNNDIGNTVSFINLDKNIKSRTLYKDNSFSVIATIGHFKEGYLLLLTNEHFPSFAHFNAVANLERLYKKIKSELEKVYGPLIIFEHGPMPVENAIFSACGGGGCVDHAHLHFIPSNLSFNELEPYLFNKFDYMEIKNLDELKVQAIKNSPYLFVELSDGHKYIFDNPKIPSQYLRKVVYELEISNKIDPDKWSFRQHPEIKNLEKTVNKLKGVLNI